MNTTAWLLASTLFISTLAFTSASEAARVVNFKGRKVLINLEQTSGNNGDRFYVLSTSGQKIGMVELKKVKGKKALALLLKGKLEKGASLQSTGSAPAAPTSAPIAGNDTSSLPTRVPGKIALGGSLGMSFNSMDVTKLPIDNDFVSVGLAGSSFNFSVLGDYYWKPSISFRTIVGIETLQAESTSKNPKDNQPFSVDISYLGMTGLARYHVMPGKLNTWVGTGFSYLMAMSKDSNTIDAEGVSSNQTIPFVGGVDIELNSKSYIPVQFEYHYWLGQSATIATSTMVLRAGYVMRF